MKLLILPNQLFDKKYFPKGINEIVLWEHPDFFTKFNFNKKKLILHRSSMKKYYNDVLKSLKLDKLRYINFSSNFNPKGFSYFDPINRIDNFDPSLMIESPNFLLSKQDYEEIYNNKKSKRINFTSYFYPLCKEKIQFLQNTNSKDKENRLSYNNNLPIHNKPIQQNNRYIISATSYVNKHFPNNHGNTNNFIFPIHKNHSMKWLRFFINKNLDNFGPYQDSINKDHDNMFHSMLSASLNIGLLNPDDVVEELRRLKNTPINSLEGYFRQLCWREYQRYCYIYYYEDLTSTNYLELNNSLEKEWYDGTLGVEPVDKCIIKAFDSAYLHHIERLMIMGNFMVLSEIKPDDVYKWFLEFAIDSYDWVMIQNVYDMVCYTSKGITSYKPYISSSNYIVKLSNYSKKDEWTSVWDKKYRSFLQDKKSLLINTPLRIYLKN